MNVHDGTHTFVKLIYKNVHEQKHEKCISINCFIRTSETEAYIYISPVIPEYWLI